MFLYKLLSLKQLHSDLSDFYIFIYFFVSVELTNNKSLFQDLLFFDVDIHVWSGHHSQNKQWFLSLPNFITLLCHFFPFSATIDMFSIIVTYKRRNVGLANPSLTPCSFLSSVAHISQFRVSYTVFLANPLQFPELLTRFLSFQPTQMKSEGTVAITVFFHSEWRVWGLVHYCCLYQCSFFWKCLLGRAYVFELCSYWILIYHMDSSHFLYLSVAQSVVSSIFIFFSIVNKTTMKMMKK